MVSETRIWGLSKLNHNCYNWSNGVATVHEHQNDGQTEGYNWHITEDDQRAPVVPGKLTETTFNEYSAHHVTASWLQ